MGTERELKKEETEEMEREEEAKRTEEGKEEGERGIGGGRGREREEEEGKRKKKRRKERRRKRMEMKEKLELRHSLSPGNCSGHQAGGRPGRQAGTIKASTVGCYEDLLGPAVPLSSEGIKNKLLRAST